MHHSTQWTLLPHSSDCLISERLGRLPCPFTSAANRCFLYKLGNTDARADVKNRTIARIPGTPFRRGCIRGIIHHTHDCSVLVKHMFQALVFKSNLNVAQFPSKSWTFKGLLTCKNHATSTWPCTEGRSGVRGFCDILLPLKKTEERWAYLIYPVSQVLISEYTVDCYK